MNLLVQGGILEKRRGMGVFVVVGAGDQIRRKGQTSFKEKQLPLLLQRAKGPGFEKAELLHLVEDLYDDEVGALIQAHKLAVQEL